MGSFRKSKEMFSTRIINVWGNRVTPLEEYKGSTIKIGFKCNVCNYTWKTRPHDILRGHGCPECGNKRSASSGRKTNDEFVKELYKITKGGVVALEPYPCNNKQKIKFRCKEGHTWETTPAVVLKGFGCPVCSHKSASVRLTYSFEKTLYMMYSIFGGHYIPIKATYSGISSNCVVYCQECGNYSTVNIEQGLCKNALLCHHCGGIERMSRGEKIVKNYLMKRGLYYQYQARLGCRDINELPFDFYLPKLNTIIEYDGRQHTESFEHWGGEKNLHYIQRHDKIKNEFARSRGYKMIRIPYRIRTLNNINKYLEKELALQKGDYLDAR